MADDNVTTVRVDERGSITEKHWFGDFKVKKSLSLRDQLARDRHRRALLGEEPGAADARADSIAYMLAEIWPRIVEAPAWWREQANGLDLLDDNMLTVVYNAVMAVDVQVVRLRQKEEAEARKKLEAKHREEKTREQDFEIDEQPAAAEQ